MLAAVPMALVPASSASADTIGAARVRASQLAGQIASEALQVHQISQQFARAQDKVQVLDGQVTTAQAALTASQRQMSQATVLLRHQAVLAYLQAGTPGRLADLLHEKPTSYAVSQVFLGVAAAHTTNALDGFRLARSALRAHQATLHSAQHQAQAGLDTIARLREGLQSKLAQEAATLSQVKGHLAQMVAQAEAARAAQQVRLVAERQAAQQAAARHAAQISARAVAQAAAAQQTAAPLPRPAAPQQAGSPAPQQAAAAPSRPATTPPAPVPSASPTPLPAASPVPATPAPSPAPPAPSPAPPAPSPAPPAPSPAPPPPPPPPAAQGLPLPAGLSALASPPPTPAPTAGGGAFSALRQCESGGSYTADTGNGYYGAYQFSAATWHNLGYSGLPSQAPPAQQDQAAARLQAESGWGQWPACAAMLGL